jgi:acetolactate synthase-1/2/3 large subunit
MNGAELLVKTARKAGIDVCFANAGTTEMPIAIALDSEPGMKAVLGLFEGVCTGAADGYGRLLDKPASTLLHLGVGLANGASNLHNARRGRAPVVNIIGEHATWHRDTDSPSSMDIESMARAVSKWCRTSQSTRALSPDIAEAAAAARYGQISTLITPSDYLLADGKDSQIAESRFSFEPVDSAAVDKAARLLRAHDKTALIMSGRALRQRGLQAAARIKAATGCDLITEHLFPYVERGAGLPDVIRIPYFPGVATELLSKYEAVVLVSVNEPVSFFGYTGVDSYLLSKEQQKVAIAGDKQDAAEVLENLAGALNAPPFSKVPGDVLAQPSRPAMPHGELTPENVCLTLAALQPENAVIMDEGITTSNPCYPLSAGLPQHSFLTTAGGSIGWGIPASIGAAVACPDRPVIAFQADGSAMYTIEALWTVAREALNTTTLICSNRSYNILKIELSRIGITSPGPKVSSLLDLDRPDINWIKISEGMGVPAVSVDSAEGLAKELRRAFSEPGPHLIEMIVTPPATHG